MILGMNWIDMVAPVVLHTTPHNLSLMVDWRIITLYGITDESELTTVDTNELRRMLQCGTSEVVAELSMINVGATLTRSYKKYILTYRSY